MNAAPELDLADRPAPSPAGNDVSHVDRVKLRGAETSTRLLTADNCSIRSAPDGSLIVELFRYGADDQPIESYQFHFCPVDRDRLRAKV
jgi:hypothetical protein